MLNWLGTELQFLQFKHKIVRDKTLFSLFEYWEKATFGSRRVAG